jgi:hypothetical protein
MNMRKFFIVSSIKLLYQIKGLGELKHNVIDINDFTVESKTHCNMVNTMVEW